MTAALNQTLDALRQAVGDAYVIHRPDDLLTYELDASWYGARAPHVVVLPGDVQQVARVVQIAAAAGLPLIARGAGTGIAGGATPTRGGMVLALTRLTRVERLDVRSRQALVQAGVINAELSSHTAPHGLFFAPDPSSQRACTIGGNIANNSGGPHCLKYGTTTNHILAVELVRPDGTLVWTGDGSADPPGYDLTGLLVGSEGTLGVVTRARVRLTRLPEQARVVLALFHSVVSASAAVSAIIAAGYLPTSLEVMDHNAIRAVNYAYGLGLPDDAEALLVVEVDGVAEGLEESLNEITALCQTHGAFDLRPARTAAEQARVWLARKAVAGAIGRLAPAYYLVDTVVPRTRLPLMMAHVERLRQHYDMQVCNVFHAGDGNLHPLVLYDPRDADQTRRAHAIAVEVLRESINQGGVVSGEHGIGIEKQEYLPLLYTPADLAAMATVYAVFNPDDTFNPGKIFPSEPGPLALARQRAERLAANRGTLPPEALAQALADVAGPDWAYQMSGPAAGQPALATPAVVVFPADLEQLSAVLRLCHRAGANVFPSGLVRTEAYERASIPTDRPAVVLSVRRLAGVHVYEPDDLTITVGAGTTLAELQQLLAHHNQWLPLEVADPEHATLGALVSMAVDGPCRAGYGTLRDWLLGATVVEVDGTISRCGGRVVKNVSGYDLAKLYHGSYGTLVVIAAVSLRTFPRPHTEQTILAALPDRAAAPALLEALAGTYLRPAAVEYLEGWQAAEAGQEAPALLAVRVAGTAPACERHVREFQALAGRHGTAAALVLDPSVAETLWQRIAAFAARRHPPGEALMRVAVPAAQLGAALADLASQASTHGARFEIAAHATDGIIHARVRGEHAALASFYAGVVACWPRTRLLAGEPALAAELGPARWGTPDASAALMRALKQAFDPDGQLNPGGYGAW